MKSTPTIIGATPPAVKVKPPVIIRDEPLLPPSVMLLGDVGAGKTYAIISALKAGLKVFVIVTENAGVDSLIEAVKVHRLPIENLHWARCTPARQSWAVLKDQAKISNSSGVSEIQTMTTGLDRFKYPAFMKLIDICANFRCDRTKEEYGDVLSWSDDTLLALDSLSGLGDIASTHVCGHRITMTQPEFGVVQNHIMILLNQLTATNCYFMVSAHTELETDEVKGTTKLMASTVGKKLAPKLPRIFSDVIYAKISNDKYVWSTKEANVATKSRYLKPGMYPADFKLLIDGYRERKAEAEKEMQPETIA